MKKKSSKSNVPEWVDVHNDDLMVSLGIRLPNYVIPDFSKTAKEKELLKKLRKKSAKYYSASKREKHIQVPCYNNLIVYTKRKDHSTCSYKCYIYEIKNIINAMHPDVENIVKFYFNGKTYFPQKRNNGTIYFMYP